MNKAKPAERRGEVLLVNASNFFIKEKPKNALTDEGVAAVVEVYRKWEPREKLSRVITLAEVREADYNLSPSLFVGIGDEASHRSLLRLAADLESAKAERERADAELSDILAKLKING